MTSKITTSTGWRVVAARFELSAPTLAACPPSDLPEIAVCGRSNVGKSSLFNAFVVQRGLARVSRTPGRTRLLNFFHVTLRHPRWGDRALRWVDLPGYGYAAAPPSVRETFGPMIEAYLQQRASLRELLLLIDSRRGVTDQDLQLIDFWRPRGLPLQVIATKCDKIGKAGRGLVARPLADALGLSVADIQLTSASTGLGLGDEGKHGGLAQHLARLIEDRPAPAEEALPPAEPA
ncbi:MAG: ribosome biogenesis GTP-binding protein YsxC [Nannocystis sp.]|nr:ribosome biogenesis GTP-binding protein YsxC [Nannocystis sp.]